MIDDHQRRLPTGEAIARQAAASTAQSMSGENLKISPVNNGGEVRAVLRMAELASQSTDPHHPTGLDPTA